MVLTNKVAFIGGTILAVIAAVIAVLQLSGPWEAGLQAIVIIGGAFGIQQLSPAQIVAKIPAHITAVVSAVLTGANVLLQTVSLPVWAHAVIGAVFAAAAALGIVVTGVAVSQAAAAEKAAVKAAARRVARRS